MNVVGIDGAGDLVVEPDWTQLFSDVLETAAARDHWRIVVTELRERTLLAPANGHAIQRLVCSYVTYDRAMREVAENGAVTKPRRGNTKAIARISPHFSAMREMAADAASLEAELGLSPRRRSGAAKAERKARTARPSDSYLRPVAK